MENTRFDLEQAAQQPHHLRARGNSGYIGFVEGTISGIRTLGFPPFTAHDYRLLTTFVEPVTGCEIRDWEEHNICESVARLELVGGFPDAADRRSLFQGATWLGWGIERKGAVHWRHDDRLISFRLKTVVAPLADRHGFCLSLEFSEIDIPGDTLILKLEHNDFTLGAVRPWVWVDAMSDFRAIPQSPMDFEGKDCALCLGVDGGTLEGDKWTLPLKGKETFTVHLAAVIAPTGGQAREKVSEVLQNAAGSMSEAGNVWKKMARHMQSRLPEFHCDRPELEAFYLGSLRTQLINRWDSPEYFTQPFFSTSGLGFANGAYFWDMSYCPKIMSLWEPEAVRKHLRQWLTVDPHATNQFSGFDGAGMGGWYALNDFALTKLIHQYCGVTGDRDFLTEPFGEGTVIGRLEQLLEESENKFEAKDGLLNFGRNENLLELRSSGYEGYVPSPNGERYFCWQRLAELKEWVSLSGEECRAKAEAVRHGFFKHLWNAEKGWPEAITPEGRRVTPYSIQVFNLLSSQLFKGEELDALLRHLNEEEFVSSHGLESISKKDIRYELNDLDWSGGGTFVGVCPVMAEDLYQLDRPQEAWKVLGRLLWWPGVFPYYPQVVRAKKAGYEERQRPICIASGAAAEVVIFGIFGLRYELDGRASACIQLPPDMKTASLRGIRLRQGSCDLVVENGKVQITHDGATIEAPLGQRFDLPV